MKEILAKLVEGKDLTKEEIETFFNVSDKIRKNLGEKEECIHKRIKD